MSNCLILGVDQAPAEPLCETVTPADTRPWPSKRPRRGGPSRAEPGLLAHGADVCPATTPSAGDWLRGNGELTQGQPHRGRSGPHSAIYYLRPQGRILLCVSKPRLAVCKMVMKVTPVSTSGCEDEMRQSIKNV